MVCSGLIRERGKQHRIAAVQVRDTLRILALQHLVPAFKQRLNLGLATGWVSVGRGTGSRDLDLARGEADLVAAAEAAVVWSGDGDEPEAWNAVLLPFHLDRISALACGPAQAPIVTVSRDGTAALWSEAGTLLQVPELNGQGLSSVAWRSDRKTLGPGG
jgi:hypothetical protein